MSSRDYCLITVLLTTFGLTGVACLNWVVDPFGQYGTGVLPVIVQASRTQKLDLMEGLECVPPGLILGSSRMLKFEPNYLQRKLGVTFFNAAVNHGRPADYLAMVRWYHERWNVYPKIVILGVDSAALNKIVPLDARIATEDRLAKVVPECISLNDSLAKYRELIGFKQMSSSLRSIRAIVKNRHESEPIEFYKPDGLLVYRQREEEISNGNYDFQVALKYNEQEFENVYRAFDEFSEKEVSHLVKVVRDLREHGSQVYLFVTPFHPELRATLSNLSHFEARESEAHELLKLLSKHHGAYVSDCRDIASYKGDPTEFVDGIHPLETNTRLIIDRLLPTRGDTRYAIQ